MASTTDNETYDFPFSDSDTEDVPEFNYIPSSYTQSSNAPPVTKKGTNKGSDRCPDIGERCDEIDEKDFDAIGAEYKSCLDCYPKGKQLQKNEQIKRMKRAYKCIKMRVKEQLPFVYEFEQQYLKEYLPEKIKLNVCQSLLRVSDDIFSYDVEKNNVYFLRKYWSKLTRRVQKLKEHLKREPSPSIFSDEDPDLKMLQTKILELYEKRIVDFKKSYRDLVDKTTKWAQELFEKIAKESDIEAKKTVLWTRINTYRRRLREIELKEEKYNYFRYYTDDQRDKISDMFIDYVKIRNHHYPLKLAVEYYTRCPKTDQAAQYVEVFFDDVILIDKETLYRFNCIYHGIDGNDESETENCRKSEDAFFYEPKSYQFYTRSELDRIDPAAIKRKKEEEEKKKRDRELDGWGLPPDPKEISQDGGWPAQTLKFGRRVF